MMTRKDYNLIANTFRRNRVYATANAHTYNSDVDKAYARLAIELATDLALANENFQAQRFLTACEPDAPNEIQRQLVNRK